MHTTEPHAPSQPSGNEHPARTGPPDWVRVLLLVALLGAVLGGMNWLVRSGPGPTAPAPTLTAVPTAVAQPIVQATRLPTPVPTLVPTPRPTAAPTATAMPTVAPTVAPAVAAALASDWWNWSSDSVSDAQKAEVLAALDQYWSALRATWLDLDPQHLVKTTTEPRLDDLRGIVLQDREAGMAVNLDVKRTDFAVHYVDGNLAVAYETYIDQSTSVNSVTRAPLEPVVAVPRESSYLLVRVAGTFKIAQVAHHENQSSD
jgi:hypothetical protein